MNGPRSGTHDARAERSRSGRGSRLSLKNLADVFVGEVASQKPSIRGNVVTHFAESDFVARLSLRWSSPLRDEIWNEQATAPYEEATR